MVERSENKWRWEDFKEYKDEDERKVEEDDGEVKCEVKEESDAYVESGPEQPGIPPRLPSQYPIVVNKGLRSYF